MAGWISGTQFERDHNGLRNNCAACGHEGTASNPLTVDNGGMRVHSKPFDDARGDRCLNGGAGQ